MNEIDEMNMISMINEIDMMIMIDMSHMNDVMNINDIRCKPTRAREDAPLSWPVPLPSPNALLRLLPHIPLKPLHWSYYFPANASRYFPAFPPDRSAQIPEYLAVQIQIEILV